MVPNLIRAAGPVERMGGNSLFQKSSFRYLFWAAGFCEPEYDGQASLLILVGGVALGILLSSF